MNKVMLFVFSTLGLFFGCSSPNAPTSEKPSSPQPNHQSEVLPKREVLPEKKDSVIETPPLRTEPQRDTVISGPTNLIATYHQLVSDFTDAWEPITNTNEFGIFRIADKDTLLSLDSVQYLFDCAYPDWGCYAFQSDTIFGEVQGCELVRLYFEDSYLVGVFDQNNGCPEGGMTIEKVVYKDSILTWLWHEDTPPFFTEEDYARGLKWQYETSIGKRIGPDSTVLVRRLHRTYNLDSLVVDSFFYEVNHSIYYDGLGHYNF